MIVWGLPVVAESVLVEQVAAELFNGTDPQITVDPSLNVTVPLFPGFPLTLAVKVTDCPYVEGLALDASEVFVFLSPASVKLVCACAPDV